MDGFVGEPCPPTLVNKSTGIVPGYAGGIQLLYFFPNGRGASVVRHGFSYGGDKGLWELGVVLGDKDDWALDYQTEITNDVLGHLTESDVVDLLKRIQALPPAAGEA